MLARVPDIYIIGAQKSGTTTLYDWLAQHPEIFAHPLAKDFPYFSNDITFSEGENHFFSFTRDAPEYQLVLGGEANAMYALTGPARMYELMPSSRLLVILRNPVDRAFSAYCYAVERLMENRTFEHAIRVEIEGMKYPPEDALQRDYLAHGHYAQQLKNLYHFFSPAQVKVTIFEDLIQEPQKYLSEIFQFINVSEYVIPCVRTKNQTKGGYRSRLLAKLIHERPSSKVIRSIGRVIIPYSLRTGIRRKLVDINRVSKPKPEFHDHVLRLLENYYKEEVAELQSLLGKDIISWQKNGGGKR